LLDKYYAQASLVMVPSLYKTSIVYSERPLSTDGQLTFTRNSNATRVNSRGLVEKVRTNLFTESNTIAGWIKSATGVTVTGGQAGYDGTNNAWLIEKNNAPFKFVRKDLTTPTGIVTFSVHMKAGTLTTAALRLLSTPDIQVVFDLTTGAVISNINALAVSSESVGNGWFRYSISGNMTTLAEQVIYPDGVSTTNAGNILIQNAQMEQGDIATDYIPTTTSARSTFAGITVDGTSVPNVPRLDYSGGATCPSLLLEPQRTNLNIFSEDLSNATWDKLNVVTTNYINQVVSPDGYTNADLAIPNTTSDSYHGFQLGSGRPSLTAGTVYTYSLFAKANGYSKIRVQNFSAGVRAQFDLSTGTLINQSGTTSTFITPYGNGWYRVGFTYTQATTVNAYWNILVVSTDDNSGSAPVAWAGNGTSSVAFWGSQIEVGSYATSYIPTLGSAVTRLADAAYKTGISSLIGQTEGTMFIDFFYDSNNGENRFSLSDNSAINWVFIGTPESGASNSSRFYIRVNNSVKVDVGASSFFTYGQRYKLALAYKSGDWAVYGNGVQLYSGSDTIPAFTNPVNTLNFRSYISSSEIKESERVNQTLLFPTRLTNAQLAELTTL